MPDEPLVKVGDVFIVDPYDYMLGHGPHDWGHGRPVNLRVTHVPMINLGRTDWVALVGVELGSDGTSTRWVGVIRTKALPGYRRPPCELGREPSRPPFTMPGGQL